MVLNAAIPAHAFTATSEPDGSTTYFFAYPSLRIESSAALDLTGLQRIEAVAGGVLARGTFELLATETDAAGLLGAAGASWTGYSDPDGYLDILAGGDLNLGAVTLAGFRRITLSSSGTLSSGSLLVFNGSVEMPGGTITFLPDDPVVITASNISLDPALLAIPEPDAWALLVAGLVMLGAAARRKRNDAFPIG